MSIIKRAKAPTPVLFKNIRNIGLAMTGISAAIIASPVVLPVIIVKAAGYLTVAGAVASAVSQLTTNNNDKTETNEPAM